MLLVAQRTVYLVLQDGLSLELPAWDVDLLLVVVGQRRFEVDRILHALGVIALVRDFDVVSLVGVEILGRVVLDVRLRTVLSVSLFVIEVNVLVKAASCGSVAGVSRSQSRTLHTLHHFSGFQVNLSKWIHLIAVLGIGDAFLLTHLLASWGMVHILLSRVDGRGYIHLPVSHDLRVVTLPDVSRFFGPFSSLHVQSRRVIRRNWRSS